MTDRPPKIVMHIGAHKTATTHLQRSIRRRVGALAEAGVYFHGPQQLRGADTSIVARFGLAGADQADAPPVDVAQSLQTLAPDGARLVMSEENYIGSLQNRYGKVPMPLYPKAVEKIAQLAAAISPAGVSICLGIRNPTHFLTSAYGQLLIGRRKVSIEKFRSKNAVQDVDWVELVGRLAACPAISDVTVWRYEDYNAIFGEICTAMLGEAGTVVVPLPDRVHTGLSGTAAAALLARDATKPEVAAIRAQYPVSDTDPAIDIFSAEEHALATALYAEQVAQIAGMDDVTLLLPGKT